MRETKKEREERLKTKRKREENETGREKGK